MTSEPAFRKPWAVLAYTVADDKSGASALDASAKIELKALCDAADFGSGEHRRAGGFQAHAGVFRGDAHGDAKPRGSKT